MSKFKILPKLKNGSQIKDIKPYSKRGNHSGYIILQRLELKTKKQEFFPIYQGWIFTVHSW